MGRYMILMHEDDNAWTQMPAEERQELLKRYYAWVDELRAAEVFDGGAPMSRQGRVLEMVDGAIVDGPYAETKEVLTGYFIVKADSIDIATQIARGCPALLHGERVMVRELDVH